MLHYNSYVPTHPHLPELYYNILYTSHNCETCQRVNSANFHAGSLQKPAPSPGRWKKITMDIVSGFSPVQHLGHTVTAVLVIVDCFSSHCHFYPITANFSAADFVSLLISQYMPLHGIPEVIHTDRGRQFENDLVKTFTGNIHSTLSFSVTAHHQSNGKAERYIRMLQGYLRTYADTSISWVELLPYAEFTINSMPSVSLGGQSPFRIDLGYNPSSPISLTYSLSEEGREADDVTELLDRYALTAKAALNVAYDKNK